VISSLDLAVIGEREIIQVAGEPTMQRIRETEENDFIPEFFKRVERNHKTIYLLGETKDAVQQMKEKLTEDFPKLVFAGEYAIDQCVGNLEAVINDMNVTAPNVIVSILPTPMQEHFFWEHKDKMNANIWYGIGDMAAQEKKHGIPGFWTSFLRREKLKSSIAKYRVKKEA
jgi:N-acetylglucosaminyldiphosphoundecaprenol N-acetyl-beta-D-mannosaminyltransferase